VSLPSLIAWPAWALAGRVAEFAPRRPAAKKTGLSVKRYMCVICGFVYDEAAGLPDHGIPPGTRFEDLPLNWRCPECGAGKEDFELIEV